MFNQKAQASSTFQLLIAAVVALAMLGILMAILGVIKLPGTGDYADAIGNALDSASTSPASLKTTDSVNLQPKSEVVSREIALNSQSGVTESQLCFAKDAALEKVEAIDVETSSGRILEYTGSSQKKIKFSVICDAGDAIEQDLEDRFEEVIDLSHCNSELDLEGSETVCIIIARSSS